MWPKLRSSNWLCKETRLVLIYTRRTELVTELQFGINSCNSRFKKLEHLRNSSPNRLWFNNFDEFWFRLRRIHEVANKTEASKIVNDVMDAFRHSVVPRENNDNGEGVSHCPLEKNNCFNCQISRFFQRSVSVVGEDPPVYFWLRCLYEVRHTGSEGQNGQSSENSQRLYNFQARYLRSKMYILIPWTWGGWISQTRFSTTPSWYLSLRMPLTLSQSRT